jgi:general secretion pathway protein D
MSRLSPTAILLVLLIGCILPPRAALACPRLAQLPGAPSGPASPAVPTPPSTTTPARPSAIVLNFDNADIEAVIQTVSEVVGFNYVLAPDVRGKVTVRTPRAIGPEDVFSVFLSILEVHGLTAVKVGEIYKIVRTERARERAIRTFIGPMPGQSSPPGPGSPPRSGAAPPTPPHSGTTTVPGATAAPPRAAGGQPIDSGPTLASDQLITHVLMLRFASAPRLTRVVGPLVSGRGRVIADPRANVLVVTDTVANVGRLLEVVKQLDLEVAADEVHVVPLHFADANDLAGILNEVFADAGLARPPVIVGDRRTNSLVIRARRSDLQAIERLLGRVK